MSELDLVRLSLLMRMTSGRPEVVVGLIDGPVAINQPGIATGSPRVILGKTGPTCIRVDSEACFHGTMVAAVLCAKRGSTAPAICPDCSMLIRPVFAETTDQGGLTIVSPKELGSAILECVEAGAWVINLSLAYARLSSNGEREIEEALGVAAERGVIVVAAAGNQGTVGGSAITRHPWVIPAVACDLHGRPVGGSNLGGAIGTRGLRAPGDNIPSLGSSGEPSRLGGTSAAAPFITGAIALLWSLFPAATSTEVKSAVLQGAGPLRRTIVPRLLDAWSAYRVLMTAVAGR
jgi:subtilisin family serine protease